MPTTVTDLIISPITGATVSRMVLIQLAQSDGSGTFSAYSATLEGISLPAPASVGALFGILIDTRRYAGGSNALVVDATHSTIGSVTQSATYTLDNSLQTETEYFSLFDTTSAEGMQFSRARAGMKFGPLPGSYNLRDWCSACLLTNNTPSLPDMETLDPTNSADMAALFALGQGISFTADKVIAGTSEIEAAQIYRLPATILTYPGTTLYLLLQLVPEEVQSWWATGYEAVTAIKRADTSGGATEAFYVLSRNTDESGAAIWLYQVTGSLAAPTVSFTKAIDLTAEAPEAIDFCVVGQQAFVVRDSQPNVRVFDLTTGFAIVDIAIVGESKNAALIENCGGTPVLLCVNPSGGANSTTAYNLTFNSGVLSPKLLWSMNEAAQLMRWGLTGASVLGIAAGQALYLSASLASPSLSNTFPATITALGASPANAVSGASPANLAYVGLTNYAVYYLGNSGWALQSSLPGAVQAITAWEADGETLRPVAGYADATLYEQGIDGSWGTSTTLVPPSALDSTITGVTALQGVERDIALLSGSPGQPGYVAAQTDFRLLVGTNADGLFGVLQRSPLTASAGAIETDEIKGGYVVGLLDLT